MMLREWRGRCDRPEIGDNTKAVAAAETIASGPITITVWCGLGDSARVHSGLIGIDLEWLRPRETIAAN
jgi:hypothetical protein